ncbi:MAG: TIR domain-containing protein, partial [Anaerolineae bacterium]|nr:TIR domain-containing protein [Anaerolineae bacterium]
LSKTYLVEANLSGTNLSEANLTEAYLRETALSNLDLRQPKGLETVNHIGPSHIDTHTLQRSQGKIPEIFLRGCGLSDWEIENAKLYNPNLTPDEFTLITYEVHRLRFGNPIYYSCFISYASQDQALAERIYTDLQNSGVRCWYAPEDMKIGDKIRPSIDQAIRLQDKLLLILSENSVQSEWVGDEVEHALELEKERGELVLFPLRVDDAVMQSRIGWAAKLKRDRHIGDFCGWPEDGVYWQGFKRLLNDLRAEG